MMGVQTGEDAPDADGVDEAMRDAIDNMELDSDYFIYQMVQDDAVFKTIYDNQRQLKIEAQYYLEREDHQRHLHPERCTHHKHQVRGCFVRW